jgi:hypothetical protein
LLDAANDADDSHPRIGGVEAAVANAFADGILGGPEFVGHEFIDEDDRRLIDGIEGGIEETASEERDLHGFEIAASDDALVGVDEVLAGGRDAAFDVDGSPGPEFTERESGDTTSGGDGGDMFETIPELAVGVERNFLGSVVLPAEGETKGEDVVGIETGGDVLEAREAADEKPCTDKEHKGECEFDDDNRAAKMIAASPEGVGTGGAADGVGELNVEIEARDAESGGKSKENSGEERDGEREEEDARVNGDGRETGDAMCAEEV